MEIASQIKRIRAASLKRSAISCLLPSNNPSLCRSIGPSDVSL